MVSEEALIRFEDASAGSGLNAPLANHPTARKYLVETMGGGIAAFDYNGDGRIDLFFANGAELPSLKKSSAGDANRLYRNEGGGHFTDVTAATGLAGSGYSVGAAAGDFDNDGFEDLFVAGVNESHLYRNLGGQKFEDVTAASGIRANAFAVAAGWFDYDRDGLLDLFVVNYVKWSADLNPLCHDPSGRFVVFCSPRQFEGQANQLFHNLGGGRFEDVSALSGIARSLGKGMSLAIADYDGDGFPDVFVTNDTEPNFLFHNLGNGHFEERAFDAGVALLDAGKAVSSMGADFRDYDNDGLPDIVVTALTGETFPVFRNLGKGQFQDATFPSGLGPLTARLTGWGIGLVDFDNDGWKDIFTANAHVTDNIDLFSGDVYKLRNTAFRNRDGGSFAGVPAFGSAGAHRSAVFADFDGDGRTDVAVSVLGERPELWRNASPRDAQWLDLQLVGTRSNRDAIGAVIHVGEQWNSRTSSVGYASSSLTPVHFGLGALKIVPRIEIRWPGGTVQVLRNVKAGQTLLVREPPR